MEQHRIELLDTLAEHVDETDEIVAFLTRVQDSPNLPMVLRARFSEVQDHVESQSCLIRSMAEKLMVLEDEIEEGLASLDLDLS